MEETIISFKNFGFKYNAQQEPTLYDINLDIRKGEKILITGPSGCGKSTLAHCINGLIPFSYKGESVGELTVKGRKSSEMGIFELSNIIGTVLQDSDGQFVGLTVAEDIAFALENDCIENPELKARVLDAAKLVDIHHHLSHAPGELSGGQKQRVSLAGIMVDDVEVFLFDEPLANLDPATGKQAIELIDEIQKKTGAAVIIIEHRLEDVLWRSVDRIVLMDRGHILADDKPDELLSTEMLREVGVREPLYITALKYAGIKIRPELHPWSIKTIEISDEEKEQVKNWFVSTRKVKDTPKGAELLRAENISFAYDSGEQVIKNLSVKINRGELLAIVGTNGAGKSTFSKIICGFEKQQEGTLLFNGQSLDDLSIKERADRIGFVMQNPNQMISKVMIFDEVALGLVLRNVSEDAIKEKVEKTLEVCGLYKNRNWPVSALSYGQKKRATIASILALDPEMIILDEPTAGQDYRHYTEIMEFLKDLSSRGISVVMITHDMHLMLEYADRAIVFHDGQIIADDSSAAILTNEEITEKASLKQTSLYDLALMCGIDSPKDFVQHFIDYERAQR